MPQILANSDARGIDAGCSRAASRVWDAPAALRLWHLASVDAPTVAVAWALGFAWVAGVRLPVWVEALLALATWAVYVGDRLLDAHAGVRRGAMDCLRERHLFHWRHRWMLAPLAVAAAGCAAAIVLMRMPVAAQERDTVLAAAAVAYFTGVHSRGGSSSIAGWLPIALSRRVLSKELLVGVLFTAGCALPALNRAAAPVMLLLPLLFFAALAWLNCAAIDAWENASTHPCRSERGRRGNRVEEPASRPNRAISLAASLLALAGLLLALQLSSGQPRQAALIACGAASALLLGLLDRLRTRLTPLALRAAADLVLLAPLALLWR